ncbi:MAG: hypothetical protein HKN13_03490, partial [Rhodothermales bacterium]|nr:hypothetical protein [Rhodothermales bacterium]
MRRLILLLLSTILIAGVRAQEKHVFPANILTNAIVDDSQNPVRHVTLELLNSGEGREAIAEYHRLRASGALPYAQKGGSFDIGETRIFSMRDLSSENPRYEDSEFTKVAEHPRFNIWVQTAELDNGHIREQDVASMRLRLADETLADSYDPGRGIVEINTEVFGPSPDVDGDGILDVLVADILDGYDPVTDSGGLILGFFDPANLSGRNMAHINYMDSFPGIVDPNGNRSRFDPPEQTLAHEFQHLIFAKENGFGDLSFVNEGLSEWAEVVNGYTARSVFYFQEPVERAHELLDFRENFGGPFGYDYQRAGLFTNYISEIIGVLKTGAISRASGVGAYGYFEVLDELNLTLQ